MNAKKTFQLFLIEAKDRRLQTFPRTVFENHRKSLIQDCERSELRLHYTKIHQKCQKQSIWRVFESLKIAVKRSYQTGQIF